MARMKDKATLVVGGATGIGFATADRLAREGASVFLTGRRADEIEAAAAAIGHGATAIVADASKSEDLVHAVSVVSAVHGRIDALVLNAGASEPARLEEFTDAHFERLFSVNVRGAVYGMQAAAAVMREGASAVLVGSVAAVAGIEGYGAYSATKAALRSYARTWTAELSGRGVRVNVVAPAPTDTEMMAVVPEAVRNALIAPIPMGRMARAEEVANAILFLLSDEASFVAGVELSVDGGMTQV
ncbi:hypothetical protein LTR94_024641 [Friedmanniomyces endolithicus]|nr:hypothetical protein LTR94_024641 [Friedmanniomyces endolithicus]